MSGKRTSRAVMLLFIHYVIVVFLLFDFYKTFLSDRKFLFYTATEKTKIERYRQN